MNKLVIAKDIVIFLFMILVCLFICKQLEVNNKITLQLKETQISSNYNNVFIKDRDFYYSAISSLENKVDNINLTLNRWFICE